MGTKDVRITVHFERDGEGRPLGAVALNGGGQAEQFHGWLELLRALQHVASSDAEHERDAGARASVD